MTDFKRIIDNLWQFKFWFQFRFSRNFFFNLFTTFSLILFLIILIFIIFLSFITNLFCDQPFMNLFVWLISFFSLLLAWFKVTSLINNIHFCFMLLQNADHRKRSGWCYFATRITLSWIHLLIQIDFFRSQIYNLWLRIRIKTLNLSRKISVLRGMI